MKNTIDASEWSKAIAKAWRDSNFKSQLVADPIGAFKLMGIDIPAGLDLKVVENTDDTLYFVLPRTPSDTTLSVAELEKMATNLQVAFTDCTKTFPIC